MHKSDYSVLKQKGKYCPNILVFGLNKNKRVTLNTSKINTLYFDHYRPQRSWGKVIFSVVCVKNSVYRQGSTWAGTPPEQVPPLRQVQSPGGYTLHQVHPPSRYTLLGSYTRLPGTPLASTPPRKVYPPGRYTPWAGTPPGQVHPLPLGRDTPKEQCMFGDTGNKRVVRILLECILVFICVWSRDTYDKREIIWSRFRSTRKWHELFELSDLKMSTWPPESTENSAQRHQSAGAPAEF